MIEHITMTIQQWNEWQAKYQAMESALSFYANEDNYLHTDGKVFSDVEVDKGYEARQALGVEIPCE